ncbi:peptidyl-prolyl cis-trans isomerase [Myxococcota bacterium]|nr:peptidyl-prolyl cis-trans isomerase [Myxococcota bacterium]MBU1511426.1 peptidyl-prolyl cis-trans isomerase [Myxococcota bacterium]
MGRKLLLCCITLLLMACSSKEAPQPVVPIEEWTLPSPSVGSEVVATVDGAPITVAEVTSRARAGGLTPGQALEQAIADQLVLDHALANQDPQVLSDSFKAAAVQHLISKQFEPANMPENIPDETLRSIYDEIQKRDDSPEQFADKKFFFSHGQWRSVIQFVVKASDMPDAEAVSTVESMLQLTRDHFQLQSQTGQAEFRESAWNPHYSYVPVQFEQLPPLSLDSDENLYRFGGEFDASFLDKIFALAGVGSFTEVFSTRFGLHWAYLSNIIPERHDSFDEVREELRSSIGDSHRAQRFEEWLFRLRREHQVTTAGGRK